MTYMHDEAREVLPRRAGCGRVSTLRADRPFRWRLDRGDLCRGGARSAGAFGLALIAAHFFVEDVSIASIAGIARGLRNGRSASAAGALSPRCGCGVPGWNGAWLDPAFRDLDIIVRQVADIRVPMLLLQGADDPYGTEEQLRMAERLRGARSRRC